MAANLPPPPTADELRASAAALTQTILAAEPELLNRKPVEDLIDSFHGAGKPRAYNRVAESARETVDGLAQRQGQAVVAAYLKLAMTRLFERLVRPGRLDRYPESIRAQYDIHLRLVGRDLAKRPDAYFSLDNDLVLKDLALLGERMVPAGAQLLELVSGVPRSLIRRGGAGQAFRFALFYKKAMGAFAPFYEMHTDPRRMSEFTPKGWDDFYRRTAEVLERTPASLGLIGGSWWYDPAVPSLSPQLGFLQETPFAYGANAFRYEEDEAAKAAALLRSPERQQAYDQGDYRPTTYILVWPREGMLRWAREKG